MCLKKRVLVHCVKFSLRYLCMIEWNFFLAGLRLDMNSSYAFWFALSEPKKRGDPATVAAGKVLLLFRVIALLAAIRKDEEELIMIGRIIIMQLRLVQ